MGDKRTPFDNIPDSWLNRCSGEGCVLESGMVMAAKFTVIQRISCKKRAEDHVQSVESSPPKMLMIDRRWVLHIMII